MDIRGKNVIVTGGASGIGRRTVERLLQESARVAVFDVAEGPLKDLEALHPGIHTAVCDVADPDAVGRAVETAWDRLRGIDVLINVAARVHSEVLASFSPEGVKRHGTESWDRVIATNLSGVFYVSSEVIRRMVQDRVRGLIISVSSIAAAGNIGQSAYSASKAGVNALTVTWAKELGALGIRVAAVAPGFAKTDMTLKSMSETMLGEWTKKTPLRRMAEPDEIVDGILFVIGNNFFHGRVLELDGGLRL